MPSHVLCTLFILILSFYKYTIFHNAHCCMHHSVKHQFIADIVPSTNWSIPLNPYLTFWNKYAYYFIYNISVCVSKTKYFLNIQVYYKEKNSLCTVWWILVSIDTHVSICCYCSVTQSPPTLCKPMDCNTPGLPVLHHLPEVAQTHWVDDAL